jgi:type II secretory pathway component GspD/PulD (secretin)
MRIVSIYCATLMVVFFQVGCISPPSDQSGPESDDIVGDLIQEAQGLVEAGDYVTGARMLQAIGLGGQSYDRTDEILYWLGRARAGQGKLDRAARCFDLLERYYPQSQLRFAELETHWGRVKAQLEHRAAAIARAAAANPGLDPGLQDGPKVSNIFMETNVRQALSDVSAQTGVRIVPGPMVQGLVTAEFNNTPLDDALEQMLAPLGIVVRKYADYYLVGVASKDSPAYLKLTETRRYQPRHIDAAQVPDLLPSVLGNAIRVDKASNTLSFTAALDVLERFEADLALIDQPLAQVMIETRIVEMGHEVRRALGIEWSLMETRGYSGLGVSRVAPLSSFDPSGQIDYLYDSLGTDIRATLRALDFKGVVHVRATPSVATLSGHEALIRIGQEAYFSLLQGSAAFPFITLEKIETGITLRITPQVGSSSQITTILHAEVSDVTGSGAGDLPVISLRSVDSRLRVGSGETIAVGGLALERSRQERHEIPILGRIPFLGALFAEDSKLEEETEVVIFLTSFILIDPETFLTL